MLLPLLNPKLSINQSPSFSTPLIHFPRTLPSRKFKIRCSVSTPELAPKSAIERIADKLRSLGYTESSKSTSTATPSKLNNPGTNSAGEIFIPLPHHIPKQRVGHTIDTSWSTPENPVPSPGSGLAVVRVKELNEVVKREKWEAKKRVEGRKEGRVPTLAELNLPAEELWRLREVGRKVSTKLKVGKAGVTDGIVNGIHERWRRQEVVRITCDDICRLNMKRTHDLLERKTGGLVVWRNGSHIMLYRGANYKYPYFSLDNNVAEEEKEEKTLLDEMSDEPLSDSKMYEGGNIGKSVNLNKGAKKTNLNALKKDGQSLIKGVGAQDVVRFRLPGEMQLAEEVDDLLEGLGPRFIDWWGYDPVPIDADLLPAVVPGYRKPFRLLPYGVYPKLTNDEMTTLRRLGRPIPCHFALGRNRNLQGLAAAMVKLWEKCEIVKVAVKRGMQNTNSELMAEELKELTGGTLLSRDTEFIVFYRGKDFLPLAVSSAIEDRRRSGIQKKKHVTDSISTVSDMEESDSRPDLETGDSISTHVIIEKDDRLRNIPSEQKKLKIKDAVRESTNVKLFLALEKKEKAEKILEELDKVEISEQPEPDKEGITKEERFMLRKVGLRMKPFLLLGRRGVFDGTVENMHLHWKYRELVKIISKEKSTQEVYRTARMLEAESGGILVAVERVSKGYAIIVYRGKNYKRPETLRPRTLLTKREAMKRSIEAQRRKSLQLHVMKLTKHIDELKQQAAKEEPDSVKESSILATPTLSRDKDNMPISVDSVEALKVHLGVENATVSTPMRSVSCTDINSDSLDIDRLDEQVGMITEDESFLEITESVQSSRSETGEAGFFIDMDNRGSMANSEPCPDTVITENLAGKTRVLASNKVELSSYTSTESKFGLLDSTKMARVPNWMPTAAGPLSNKERLLLRRQALKMKYRPVLAVGKSNIVTGVAKTIKTHFQKYPLAIVNVKGRAKGTSVQEVVVQLEKATGGIFISQEPSKVILYRGWGAEQEYNHKGKIIRRRTEEVGEDRGALNVSPELLAAIKLECGLQSGREIV